MMINFEKDYLSQLCEITQGNVSQAAKLSGKYRADLYELFRKYNLKPTDFRKKWGRYGGVPKYLIHKFPSILNPGS